MNVISNTPINNIYKLNLIAKQTSNVLNHQPQIETSSLDCLANYNLSFGRKCVYAFDKYGNYKQYGSVKAAQQEHGIGVKKVLSGEVCVSNAFTFAYASDIENKDGGFDMQALKNVMDNFKLAKNQPIYSIDFSGNIMKYDSIGAANSELGINVTNISSVLNGVNKLASGYMFVDAFDVEKRDAAFKLICDEDGNPVLDKKAINKARENFLYSSYNFPIVRVGVDGDVTVFESVSDLTQKTKYGKNYIFTAIKSQQKCYGYAFTKLADVVAKDKNDNVLYNEDGTFMIDSEKVNAHIQRVFKREVSN